MRTDLGPKTASIKSLPKAGGSGARRSPGRPPKATTNARRKNPDLTMTTDYLDRQTYTGAQVKLLRSNTEKNEKVTVSHILSDALVKWPYEQ